MGQYVMKITKECVPCLVRRIVFESEQSTDDEQIQTKTICAGIEELSKRYHPNQCSARVATYVHKRVYASLNDSDPYRELKKKSNAIALSLKPHAIELIAQSDDPLKTAVLCSIAANMMDYGLEGASKSPEVLLTCFDSWVKEGLGFDDYDRFVDLIKQSSEVLLFTDNAGEIVFDVLLVEQLKKINKDLRVAVVVKGEPILSDATRVDAQQVGMAEVADEILQTDGFCVGVDVWDTSDELRKRIDACDLVVCKGMANYETFSEIEIRPIAYLLRTKCQSIADSMGVSRNRSILKVYE